MNKRSACVLLLAFAVPAAAGGSSSFVLPPERAARVFEQCSRDAPSGAKGLWVPSAAQIDELEAALPAYLKTAAPDLLPLERFHRQYVGYERKGTRYIYGNFYRADLQHEGPKGRRDESKDAVVICDGGRSFWGIVYSVEKKSFRELAFNGEA